MGNFFWPNWYLHDLLAVGASNFFFSNSQRLFISIFLFCVYVKETYAHSSWNAWENACSECRQWSLWTLVWENVDIVFLFALEPPTFKNFLFKAGRKWQSLMLEVTNAYVAKKWKWQNSFSHCIFLSFKGIPSFLLHLKFATVQNFHGFQFSFIWPNCSQNFVIGMIECVQKSQSYILNLNHICFDKQQGANFFRSLTFKIWG